MPVLRLSRGIAPGTLWCGFDDIALSYHQLGENRQLDKCCRMHDFSPDKIKPGRSRDGLNNEDIVTKSNCHCERVFDECLKSVDSFAANTLGNIYFSTNRECLALRPARRCLKWADPMNETIGEEDFFSEGIDQSADNSTENFDDDDTESPMQLQTLNCIEYQEVEGDYELQLVKNFVY